MTVTEPSLLSSEALEADRRARERIASDLETNFLVEAGAGSGKTTSLVARMISHVLAGHAVESLAAVTFTRKAASELAERFREELEERRRVAHRNRKAGELELLDSALDRVDGCFVGTIHAFCGRLLRERPLEADLDPSFAEVTEDDWLALGTEFWRNWVHRRTNEEDAEVSGLRKLGIEPYKLHEAFRVVVENQDVTFPVTDVAAPDTSECRRLVRSLMQRLTQLRPSAEPEGGWDALQDTLWRLSYRDRTTPWDDSIADFCDAMAGITASKCKATQNRWSDDKAIKKQVKELSDEFLQLHESHIAPLLKCWYEHRYTPIMRVLLRARADYEKYRIETGQLGFGDLLSRAVFLLASDEQARRELGERFRYVMVDEFQDTDPLQAEVCFLLASDPSEGQDWTNVVPRSGALFVVGDPKQSIYRFRRADIETYALVKKRMEEFGSIVQLTRNFRSTPEIAGFVNRHFVNVLPSTADKMQAAFSPMIAVKPSVGRQCVTGYAVAAGRKDAIYEDDAERIASWIAGRLRDEEGRKPEDFMILSWRREPVLTIARALAERNVPAVATGAQIHVEVEVDELLAVLRALADPANPVSVVAALQGMFVGASPADIFMAHISGVKFSLLADPGDGAGIVADGIRQLRKWRDVSLYMAPDALVDTLLDETGLLPHTASEEIGDTRAGMLLRIVSMLRASSVESTGSLNDAIERIEAMLENDIEGEPTLRPGRGDAVRVMNLHQAKGLEAEIVVLASPYKPTKAMPVELRVDRVGSREAVGMMKISVPAWADNRIVVAQPPRWEEAEALEGEFLAAERERLRYVAATRAKSELWISQVIEDKNGPGQWDYFTPSLGSTPLAELQIDDAPGRITLDDSVEEIAERVVAAEAARAAAAEPSYSIRSVTQSAKASIVARAEGDGERSGQRGRGRAWGRAVHRVIEAMGMGRSGDGLREFARAVAVDELGDEETRMDAHVEEVMSISMSLAGRPEWQTLMGCEERHFELPVSELSEESGIRTITEGVIDAAGFDGARWHVFDWKTDQCTEEQWVERSSGYQAQVDAYAGILSRRYGQPATATIIRLARGTLD